MKYEIDLGRDRVVEVPESMQDKIVRDYLMRRYHWVIGLSMFIVGLLIGLLAKQFIPNSPAVEATDLKFVQREFESHFVYGIIK